MLSNKHLRQVFPSMVTPRALCVCTCLYMCRCSGWQVDERCWSWCLWHSIGRKAHHVAPSGMSDAQCSHARSAGLHGNGEMWRQHGEMAAMELSVDRALPFLAMVTVTGGEYIVICAQSQHCSNKNLTVRWFMWAFSMSTVHNVCGCCRRKRFF